MDVIICPVCGGRLNIREREARCGRGHSFDRAKQGYINLLMKQTPKSKRHGDDSLMVRARRDFLTKGYYKPLGDLVSEKVRECTPEGGVIADIGCGEGYYTNIISGKNENSDFICVDISKDAAKLMAAQSFPHTTIVASAYALPIADGAADTLVNIFAPLASEEFWRVLKPEGAMVLVVPDENHLFTLKSKIYDRPYKNPPVKTELTGFELKDDESLNYNIHLSCQEDIDTLFKMTPYYYKTGERDQQKIRAVSELTTEVSFRVLTYKKVRKG